MSDFGTTIKAIKESGDSISSSDASSLSDGLKDLIEDNDYVDLLEEPFDHEFEDIDTGEVIVRLSKHYFGDEDPGVAMEFVEENELQSAISLADLMKAQFPDYNFEAKVEEW